MGAVGIEENFFQGPARRLRGGLAGLEMLPILDGNEHSRFDAIFGDDLRTLFQRRFQKIAQGSGDVEG